MSSTWCNAIINHLSKEEVTSSKEKEIDMQHGMDRCKVIYMKISHMEVWANGSHFADNIFLLIFLTENICILIKISLKFIPNIQFSIRQN